MRHKVRFIEDGSIAHQLGIIPGDELISINGQSIIDLIDYQALCANDKIKLVMSSDGAETEYEFEKDDYEPLGMEFYDDMLGKTRECVNNCRFCFVDQLPPGMRPSLSVKDDDWRLSLMMGNYVTLTTVSERELQRIINRHASPLYISVHATDNTVRDYLLRSRVKCDIIKQLRRLEQGGIQFHAQAVVCPGINDGSVLEKTIDELASMYPACLSLAVVPVGLTGHRSGLDDIKPFDKSSAAKLLDMTERKRTELKKKIGTYFVFPSDEMYVIAERDFPPEAQYEDYAQIDNGVGLCRQLIEEYEYAYDMLPPEYKKRGGIRRTICIATGISAQALLERMMNKHPITGVNVKVCAVKNRYFGESVTVAGLVTAQDLTDRMKDESCEAVLITECMLRSEGDRFLDDITIDTVVSTLGKPVIPVGRTGEELLEAIKRFSPICKES